MKTINTKGYLCPKPLIMARDGLKKISEGEKLLIITDNETSFQKLMRFLTDLGTNPVVNQKEGEFYIEVTKPREPASKSESEIGEYCDVPESEKAGSRYVVVARDSKMGEGDDELGELLIRGYFNALKGMDNLPTHIIMYNSGVKLALNNTDTAAALAELEDKGVSVIICGTCVDYFEIKEKIGAGRISNMYQIANFVANAGHVVYL